MSTNHAFTKKLRTAIKAKFQELGVDADDELPDYVMVLAANKKSKGQMKTDLQLFLSKHADKFVEWLFDAFERIQKSEADSSNEAPPPKKSASSDNAMKESDKQRTDDKKVEEKKHVRSPSVEVVPAASRLRSQVVIPERSTINSLRHKDLSRSERTRSSTQKSISRYVDVDRSRNDSSRNRDHERTRRRSRSAEKERRRRSSDSKQTERKSEKTARISDESDDEGNKKSSHRSSTKRSFSPKIHYDDEQRASSSTKTSNKAAIKEHHSEDEILTVNDDRKKEQQTTRFIIRVGNREICRTVSIEHLDSRSSPPARVDYEPKEQRKRHADDPGRAVTKLLGSQNIRLTSNARADRFGKENVKRARLQDSKSDNDVVEPYSPAPLNPQANIEEEKAIDSFLKSFNENPVAQQQQYVPQVQQVPQVQPAPMYYQPALNKNLFKLGKCKFWPNCNKNEECPYAHPTSVCTRFPNCSYGAQCLFIHPMCKFNAKCSNSRCPYTHNIKSEPYPTYPTSQKKPDLSKYRWIRPDSD